MNKIIKFGFCPIVNNFIRGQNDTEGQKLFKSGHVLNVIETKNDQQVMITCTVLAQTSISNLYSVKIMLDDARHINCAECTCKAGQSGMCKHFCALVHYINSPDYASSKTSQSQGWGKPSHRQLLGYDKGARMSDLFPPSCVKTKSTPYEVSTTTTEKSLVGPSLFRVMKFEEINGLEIMAAESLVEMVQMTDRRNLEEQCKRLKLEIINLQSINNFYGQEIVINQDIFDFYQKHVCCDVDSVVSISIGTITQSNEPKWYKERRLRITASNAHKLKGNRFDVSKVIANLLDGKKVQTYAMTYGIKNEECALLEYKKILDPGCEVFKVGLIVNIKQPWLCCSPDAILVHGLNIEDKRLIEIKCPYTFRDKPIFDQDSFTVDVNYIKMNENGLQLNTKHAVYVQVQLQMYITNIAFCDLFVYSPKGSVLITIARDDAFHSELVPRLQNFYFNNYLKTLFSAYL